ncbi:hypothetical protein HYX15_00030 [Candidatus Woesearchaeota archaeon]|nr:hypothetical protein [Candidatus Woesearchaeota archaeon]
MAECENCGAEVSEKELRKINGKNVCAECADSMNSEESSDSEKESSEEVISDDDEDDSENDDEEE